MQQQPDPFRPSPAAIADAVSEALNNDLILDEILLRLGSPFALARVAPVCDRWRSSASNAAFLRLFRDHLALHPRPRPLGFYVRFLDGPNHRTKFVPMPQRAELADVVRNASFGFRSDNPDTEGLDEHSVVLDCRNGRVLILLNDYAAGSSTFAVRSPLKKERVMDVLRPFPLFSYLNDLAFLSEVGVDATAHFSVVEMNASRSLGTPPAEVRGVRLAVVDTDGWLDHFCANAKHPDPLAPRMHRLRVRHNLYMISSDDCINGLDLDSLMVYTIELPDRVKNLYTADGFDAQMLARADGSGLYFLQVEGMELRVWLRKTEGTGGGDWELEDTIPLKKAFGHLADQILATRVFGNDNFVSIFGAGDNAEFVFLVGDRYEHIFYMNLRTREVEVVYERMQNDRRATAIHPFMMD